MAQTPSERRMTENEVVFRNFNESVQKSFDTAQKIAKEDGQELIVHDQDFPLQFYCECSDENCQKRISITPHEYGSLHKRRNIFMVLPGHETNQIEQIVHTNDTYSLVEKFDVPDQTVTTLKPSPANNS